MNKYVFLLLNITLVFAIWFMALLNEKNIYISHLSDIELIELNGDTCEFGDMYLEKFALLIVYFHPECDFCTVEMNELLRHQNEIKNVHVFFITYATNDEIESYILKYPIDKLKNATIAIDTHGEFAKKFKIKAPPTIILYNKKGKLKKIFRGAVPIKKIIKYLD